VKRLTCSRMMVVERTPSPLPGAAHSGHSTLRLLVECPAAGGTATAVGSRSIRSKSL